MRPPVPPIRQARHAAPRVLLLCLLSFALWCSQSLGLVHAVSHGAGLAGKGHGSAVSAGPSLASAPAEAAGHDGGRHQGFFAHEQGSAGCHAFDALTHADALAMPGTPCLPAAAQAFLDRQPPSGRIAPQASGFLARGPPAFLS